ncbi:hypothetical protein [Desulfovibrio sp. UCD-KL4C]|uniref:hypothetical protein n=1 Tax=Desulfovibrio sp. UCD-KL4C TaxID=2578120 RepID=UPI0025BD8352|nr:hypothetical protein [Desulfovibrio sp. UCD-KL4C]
MGAAPVGGNEKVLLYNNFKTWSILAPVCAVVVIAIFGGCYHVCTNIFENRIKELKLKNSSLESKILSYELGEDWNLPESIKTMGRVATKLDNLLSKKSKIDFLEQSLKSADAKLVKFEQVKADEIENLRQLQQGKIQVISRSHSK